MYTCTYNVITTTMGNERNPFHVTQSTRTQVFFRYFVHVTLLTALGLFVSVNIESFQYLHSLFKHANLLHQRDQHAGTQIQSINAVWRSRKRRGGKRQEQHLRKGRLLDSIVLRHRLWVQIIIYIYTEYNMRVAHLPSMKIPSLQSSKTAPHAPPTPLAYALTSHLKVQNPGHAMNARGCINQILLQTFESRKVFTCRFAADSR